ncbi:TonB-dependent receptor [Puniceicoccaceae bacterium K14]|nr:TonB-dependent receptor [Puniceicoccaceae bacterium K14]
MSKLNAASQSNGIQCDRSRMHGKLELNSSHLSSLPFIKLAVASCLIGSTTLLIAQDDDMMEIVESFEAIGQGESRATNSLDLESIDISFPGIQPEKMIDKVPGVNVVTRDPFGFYEFGNDIRIRAFDIDNLGVSLDGVPVGNSDARYGTPIGRIISGPNIANIKVSQGAGDVTTPAYQALGGSIQYTSIDPTDEQGVYLEASYGDFDHISLFGRFNTGEILPGLTSYFSAYHFEFSPRGLVGLAKGENKRYEFKSKYELPSGKGDLTFSFVFNDRDDYDTAGLDWQEWQDLEAGNYRGTGEGYIEFTPWDFPDLGSFNYADMSDEGRNIGPPTYIDPSEEAGEGVNAQYYNLWRNGRMDTLYSVNLDYEFSDNFSVNVTPYYQDKENYGLFGRQTSYAEGQIRAAYKADPDRTDIWGILYYDVNGNPLNEAGEPVEEYSSDHAISAPTVAPPSGSEDDDPFVAGVPGRTGRDENFGGHRWGITASFEYETEKHKILFGGWHEVDHHGTERPNYNLEGGSITGAFLYDQFNFLNYTRYIDQTVTQMWVQDTFKAVDGKLDIIFGIKAIQMDRDAHGFLAFSDWIANEEVERSVSYDDYFLPQLGIVYKVSDSSELFLNYSENMATPDNGTITTAGDGFDADILKPEYSDNIDIGFRGTIGDFSYTAQAYMIEYTDRILSSAVPVDSADAGAAGNSVFQNVGGVDSIGAELSGVWNTPIEGLKLVGSVAFQETTFQQDLRVGTITAIPTDEEGNEIIPEGFRYEELSGGGFAVFEDIEGNDLGNTPFTTINLDAIYTKGQFRFNLGGKYFDDVYVNTLNTQPVDSYSVFEAGVTYSGKAGTSLEGWTASLSVYNLFDQYFWLARSYNDDNGQVLADRGRQFTLTLKTEF